MKKHLLHAVATAAVLVTLSFGAQAQNLAIVNGKAVPKTRMDALAQQVVRSRPSPQEKWGEDVGRCVHAHFVR